MSSSNRLRWSGMAAMVGSVLVAIIDMAEFSIFGETPGSAGVTSSTWALIHSVFLVGVALMLLGLMGLYARQSEQSKALGLIAFLVAFAGTLLMSGLVWGELFLVPTVAGIAPDTYDALGFTGSYGVGLFVSYISIYLGWLLFGLASLLARVFPRVAAVLLMVGPLLALVFGVMEIPAASIVFDIVFLAGVAWMGLALWSEKSAPGM